MKHTEIFDVYLRFVAERMLMYERRLVDANGQPWTHDPILARHRFTNVYRVTDRVSQKLVRDVLYGHDSPATSRETFFRATLFKMFNRIETWEALDREFGPLRADTFPYDDAVWFLHDLRKRTVIYSAAYIIPSPPGDSTAKHENHLDLLRRLVNGHEGILGELEGAGDLRGLYEACGRIPGFGRFFAFQHAVDLAYSAPFACDESGFVVAGPGAIDGIAKCFEPGYRRPEDVIAWVVREQEQLFEDAGIRFRGLFGRRLQPIDAQNCFCEISKYTRVSHPHVSGANGRTTIKQNYSRSRDPFPWPVFPSHWALDAEPGFLGAVRNVSCGLDMF